MLRFPLFCLLFAISTRCAAAAARAPVGIDLDRRSMQSSARRAARRAALLSLSCANYHCVLSMGANPRRRLRRREREPSAHSLTRASFARRSNQRTGTSTTPASSRTTRTTTRRAPSRAVERTPFVPMRPALRLQARIRQSRSVDAIRTPLKRSTSATWSGCSTET